MSAEPTLGRACKSNRAAAFILVNDAIPRHGGHCTLCGKIIEKGYVRDTQTRMLFCDTQCFAGYSFSLKKLASKVS